MVKTKSSGLSNHTSSKIPWNDLALIAVCFIWGINFSVIKISLVYFDPLAFNAVRFPMAALVLLAMLKLKGPIPVPKPKHYVKIILLGILGNIVYQLLFIYGIDKTLAGNSVLRSEAILGTVSEYLPVYSGRELMGYTEIIEENESGFVVLGETLDL